MERQYKIDLQNWKVCGLNSCGSEEGTVASSCEYGNGFSVSTRHGKLAEQLTKY